MTTVPAIASAQPRTTAQMRFPDGRVLEGPLGTTLEAFTRAYYAAPFTAIAALANGRLRELTYAPLGDESIEPLEIASSEGIRIYRRSLSFLLVTAAQELYPRAEIYIDYSIPTGGYFCQVLGDPQFSGDELAELEAHMHVLVEQDDPITRVQVPIDEAKEIFRRRNEEDKLRLVDKRGKDQFMMYRLRQRQDAFYGYMVPSTGYLRQFALREVQGGFILQYPRAHQPGELTPLRDAPKLHAVFREYGSWLRLLHIEDIGQINEAIKTGRARETVLVSEALHERKIAHIAGQITDLDHQARLVLIAGPSSSGKTTFSKRLAIQLLTHGLRPFTLEMDRYFLDREFTPRDEQGQFDFEALQALDLVQLNKDVSALLAGATVQLPQFNFIEGKREAGPTVTLADDQVIIAEGIHGLNPALLPAVPEASIFRIYISALTQLNIDRHNRVSTTDTRLLRRIVRDAAHRGWTAEDTLAMWEKVRGGEKRNIFPYQEYAHAMFNSALVYELAALKPLACPLLLQVKSYSRSHVTARRLLALLNLIEELSADVIPDNSILREFIGGSILSDYLPGKVWQWKFEHENCDV
ncbi:MAG: nucleoside kinase [bacterium]|nr:nucleoside kinase [bacterium]